jgi:hypothetical protein
MWNMRMLMLILMMVVPSLAAAGPLGEISKSYVHVGGGLGAGGGQDGAEPLLTGRANLGAGAYTIGVYGGGELALTFDPAVPLSAAAIGTVGVHLPIPVVHPLVGLRAGPGLARVDGANSFQWTLGGQAGVIVRAPGQRLGLRLMVDADAVFGKARPGGASLETGGGVYPQIVGSVGFVF